MPRIRRIFFFFFLFLFFVLPSKTYASNFSTDYNVTYSVGTNATTRVAFSVTLTNTTDQYYASSYNIKVGFKNIDNVKASDPDGTITPNVTKSATGENIELNFNKRVVGQGNKLNFNLSFDTSEVADSNGSIWEVNIPGLSNQSDFSSFNVTVLYPNYLGKPAFIKPDISNVIDKSSAGSLSFSKGDLGTGGISIAFGQFQIYSYDLTYHLDNKNLFPITTEIALPPSTNYQDIEIESINPLPKNVYIDPDGNWLAQYSLSPSETIKVEEKGKSRVYLNPKNEVLQVYSNKDLLPEKYWETTDPKIKSTADGLKTPRAIYDYVVNNLTYDYSRVTSQEPRLGALNVLQNTTSAVCLEFTDLFVTLSRAAGIPAREVDGFANTKNTQERPLSLIKDVLHAWPEYFDKDSQSWVMVDPTWGNTTNGIDYFNTLDFDHFAFVIKGDDSSYPVPAGGYKRQQDLSVKDVDVKVGGGFQARSNLQVDLSLPNETIPLIPVSGNLRIRNIGSAISDREKLIINSSFLVSQRGIIAVNRIPPYGYIDIPINFKNGFVLTKKTDLVTISLGKNVYQQRIIISPFTAKSLTIGGIFLVFATVLSFIVFKSWGLFLQKFSRGSNLRGEGEKS